MKSTDTVEISKARLKALVKLERAATRLMTPRLHDMTDNEAMLGVCGAWGFAMSIKRLDSADRKRLAKYKKEIKEFCDTLGVKK